MPLDPQAKALLDVSNAAPPIELSDDPGPARAYFKQMTVPPSQTPAGGIEDRSVPGPGGEIPIRIYRPGGEGPHPVLVYFHGGGWVIGDLDTHDGACRDLCCGADCMVVSVDYRLAPEHPFPACPQDCYAATAWVAENAGELGADASRMAVGGDSAGGNLATVVSLMCRDGGGPSLRHQLLIYPVTQYGFDTPSYSENAEGYLLSLDMMKWFWDQYLTDPSEGLNELASPLLAKDLSGLPPATVLTAEFDPLRDEGEAYANKLAAAGVKTSMTRYDGLFHGFFGMGAAMDKADEAMKQVCETLRSALAE